MPGNFFAPGFQPQLVPGTGRPGPRRRCWGSTSSCFRGDRYVATSTVFRLLLDEGWQGRAGMQLIAGGEVPPLPLARSLASRCRVFWNQYGPSETAICATRERFESDVEKITIGRPLPNVNIHLLDAQLHPVRQGVVGEMYIGGAGVGLGYLSRPDLTARASPILLPTARRMDL